ncbi:MAG: hypothetical protein ACI8XB_000970 [Patiriisocius sp.]|jgi:hypothetical protein
MGRKLTFLIFFIILASISVDAQKLEKGFKALSEKDFFKSKRIFTKSMYGYPTTGAYGLSLMYYEQQNPFFSLDSALKFIVFADSAFAMADKKEIKMIEYFSLSKEVLYNHRLKIATKAYQLLPADADIKVYQKFIKTFSYADEYVLAVNRRDSIAFSRAREENTYDAFRDFIINYPGSILRLKADSLYAKSFFKTKVGDGDVSAYKQFVMDFPASPYIEEAYDQIFLNVSALDTKEAYNEFIVEYPKNSYTLLAWENLIGLTLKDEYSENSLAGILADYPLNPLNSQVENELKGYFVSFFPLKIDSLWGFIRGDGELLIDPIYEAAGDFVEGLAIVQKRGKNGFVNKKGDVVITIDYDEVYNFINGVAVVERGGKYGVIDRRNKIILQMDFDDVGQLSDDRILVERNELIGYYNSTGELAIDLMYENGVDFKNGLAIVKNEGLYGAIDINNEVIVPFEYDWIESTDQERFRVKQGSAFGLLSKSGELLLPLEYDWIGLINGKKPILLQKDEKIGYLNNANEIVIPISYDLDKNNARLHDFNGDFTRVKKNGKYGVIDMNGLIILPIEYDSLGLPSENFVSFRNKGKWGYRELQKSKRIIEPIYDEVFGFNRGISLVRTGNLFGVIDPNGINVLQEEYSWIVSEESIGLLIVEKNGLKGLIDRDNNLILGFKYKEIEVKNYRYAYAVDSEGIVSFYDLQKNRFIWPNKK